MFERDYFFYYIYVYQMNEVRKECIYMGIFVNKIKKTTQLSRKTKIIIVILIIISFIIGLILYNINNNQVIFVNSYENNAWAPESYGYRIYNNGTIEEYDNYDSDTELKRTKISNKDLKELKKLANSVNSNYINGINPESLSHPENSINVILSEASDAGLTEKRVYNDKEEKWIILYQCGNTMGYNDTEETWKIIELTEQLYKKYLQDDI